MYVITNKSGKHCGHEHPTRKEVEECLLKHQTVCRQAGKISDRFILEIDSLEDLEELLKIY